jgi:hypothetical protein
MQSLREGDSTGAGTAANPRSSWIISMTKPSKTDWQIAEVLADANDSLVLWMIGREFCVTPEAFRAQFGTTFPLNDIIEELEEGGFVEEYDNKLRLTERGTATLASMAPPEKKSSVSELIAADMGARAAETDLREATPSIAAASIEDEISACISELKRPIDDAESSESDRREYLLIRLNVLLLIQDGYSSFVGEFLGKVCAGEYQRSLALFAISAARSRSLEEAFTVALGIIAQFVDPEVLVEASKLGAELGRMNHLEIAITTSRHVEPFRRLLRSAGGDWTRALLVRIGLEELEQTLAQESE